MIPENIRFHHIDVDELEQVYDEKIEELQGGGAPKAVIKACRGMKDARVDLAHKHNKLTDIRDKLREIDREASAIKENYIARGLPGAEYHDGRYKRIQRDREATAVIGWGWHFDEYSSGRTTLSAYWDVLKGTGDPVLLHGGTDEQHGPVV